MQQEIYPLILKPKTETEQYIIDEAQKWFEENRFNSIINNDDVHVKNVVALGKEIMPFLIEMAKESKKKNYIYCHFLLMVIFDLYKDEIEVKGYIPPTTCLDMIVSIYENNNFVKKE